MARVKLEVGQGVAVFRKALAFSISRGHSNVYPG